MSTSFLLESFAFAHHHISTFLGISSPRGLAFQVHACPYMAFLFSLVPPMKSDHRLIHEPAVWRKSSAIRFAIDPTTCPAISPSELLDYLPALGPDSATVDLPCRGKARDKPASSTRESFEAWLPIPSDCHLLFQEKEEQTRKRHSRVLSSNIDVRCNGDKAFRPAFFSHQSFSQCLAPQ